MSNPKPIRIKPTSSGSKANASGRLAEHVIACVLNAVGHQVLTQHRPGVTDIYGKQLTIDCYIQPCEVFPRGLALESKWQDASGSVIEKLPFLVENIQQVYPCPCIIVLDGAYFARADVAAQAIRYLKSKVDGEQLLNVFSLQEFVSWAVNELKRGAVPTVLPRNSKQMTLEL